MASEGVRAGRRISLARGWRMHALAAAIAAIGAPGVAANPSGAQVVQGSATLRQDGNRLTVTTSNGAIIHWDRFSIGAGDTTRFVQPDAASQVLNRVVGSSPSEILGRLESNGRVFLINPNGVAFGRGAQVDVGALVVSTLRLSNEDFAAGRMRFGGSAAENLAAGQIRNEGAIRTASGGTVYLVAPRVENSGLIHTPEGQVLLAAGHRVSIVNPRSPEVAWEIAAPESGAVNLGEIVARQIVLHGQVVRNAGTLQATTAVVGEDGRIVLRAQRKVEQTPSGRMSATGVDAQGRVRGGEIDVQAGEQVSLQGRVEATPAAVSAATSASVVAAAASSTMGGGRGSVETVAPATVGTTAPVAQADAIRFQAGGPAVSPAGQTPTRTREPPAVAVVAPLSGAESAAGPGLGEAGMVAEATMPAFVVSTPDGPSGVGSPRLPAGAGSMAGTSAPVQRPAPSDPPPHPDPRHAIAGGVAGTGGRVRVLAREIILGEGLVLDASGPAGGGTVLIGGEQQGASAGGPNAQFVTMASGARISADATVDGPGGRVILWADDTARVHGAISARGGERGGDGGFIETSGRRFLEVTRPADASAPRGRAGEWLLDPYDVEIVGDDEGPMGQLTNDDLPPYGKAFVPSDGGSASKISNTTIVNALNAGSNVRITTGDSVGGGQNGDITISAPITGSWSTGQRTLTLEAASTGSIYINKPISVSMPGTGLDLVLKAGRDAVINLGSAAPSYAPVSLNLGTGILDSRLVDGTLVLSGAPVLSAGGFRLRPIEISADTIATLTTGANGGAAADITVNAPIRMGAVGKTSTLILSAPNGFVYVREQISYDGGGVGGLNLKFEAGGDAVIDVGVVTPSYVPMTMNLGSGTLDARLVAGQLILRGAPILNAGGFEFKTLEMREGRAELNGASVHADEINLQGGPGGSPRLTAGNLVTGKLSLAGGRLVLASALADTEIGQLIVSDGQSEIFSAFEIHPGYNYVDPGNPNSTPPTPPSTYPRQPDPFFVPPVMKTGGASVVFFGSDASRFTVGGALKWINNGSLSIAGNGSISFGIPGRPAPYYPERNPDTVSSFDFPPQVHFVNNGTLKVLGVDPVGSTVVRLRRTSDSWDSVGIFNNGEIAFEGGGQSVARVEVASGWYHPYLQRYSNFHPGQNRFEYWDYSGNGIQQLQNSASAVLRIKPDTRVNLINNYSSLVQNWFNYGLITGTGTVDGQSSDGRGPLFLQSEGRIAPDGGALLVIGGLANYGSIRVPAGGKLAIKGELVNGSFLGNSGIVIDAGGILEVELPDGKELVNLQDAVVGGSGTLRLRTAAAGDPPGTLLNRGVLRPGGQGGGSTPAIGTLSIQGNLRLEADGRVDIEIASAPHLGTPAMHDALEVQGDVTVSGGLTIDVSAPAAAIGDRFRIVQATGSTLGAFDSARVIVNVTGGSPLSPSHFGVTYALGDPARVVYTEGARLFTNAAGASDPAFGRRWNKEGNWAGNSLPGNTDMVLLDGDSQGLELPVIFDAPDRPTVIRRLVMTPGTGLSLPGGTPNSKALVVSERVDAESAHIGLGIHRKLNLDGASRIGWLSLEDESILAGTGSLTVLQGWYREPQAAVGGEFSSIDITQADDSFGGEWRPGGFSLAGAGASIALRSPSPSRDMVIDKGISTSSGSILVDSQGGLKVGSAVDSVALLAGGALDLKAAWMEIGGLSNRGATISSASSSVRMLTPPRGTGAAPLGNVSLAAGTGGAGTSVSVEAASVQLDVGGDLTLAAGYGDPLMGGVGGAVSILGSGIAQVGIKVAGAATLSASGGDARIGAANGSVVFEARGIETSTALSQTGKAVIGQAEGQTGNLSVTLRASGGDLKIGGPVRGGGDVRVVAEETGDPDRGQITIGTSGQLNSTGTGDALVVAAGSRFRNLGGDQALRAPAGRWLVYSRAIPDYHDRGGLAYGFKHYGQTYNPGSSYAGAGAGNGFLYSVTPEIVPSASGTVTRVYDGTVAASKTGLAASGSGAIDGDVVDVSVVSASFTDKNQGSNKTIEVAVSIAGAVSDTGSPVYGYRLSGAGTVSIPGAGEITPRLLTPSFTGIDKTYDGTDAATVTASDDRISGDSLSLSYGAVFREKSAGLQSIDVTNIAIASGPDAGNYSLASSSASAQATILPKPLTVTGVTAANKVYDRTTAAGLSGSPTLSGIVAGDDVWLDPSQLRGNFVDPDAGTGKRVTFSGLSLNGGQAGNYTLTPESASTTASIFPKGLSLVPGTATAMTRAYDGTYIATVDSLPALQGVIAGDAVEVDRNTVSGLFLDRNAGSGKSVSFTVTGLTGPSAGNYSLAMNATNGTGTITPRTLTVGGLGALDKTYDGTTFATVVGSPSLQGAVGNDDVSLNASGLSGSFFDRNVGTSKPVGIGGLALTGADAGNYTLGSAIASASILARTLTVSGVSALDKVYDGTTAATLSAGSLSGVVGADQVGLVAGAGNFADRNVGTGKSVSASFGIDGADAGNYVLQQPGALTASITPRPLTVSGLSARDKVYDGTTAATLAGAPALQGAVAGDAVELDAAQLRGAFADRNVGQNKPVTVSGLSITGSSAGNYTLSLDGLGATASITARTLTVSGLSAADRVYDGTTAASVGGRPQLEGAVANDVVTLDVSGLSGRFADRNVGTGKPVSVAGLSLSGADAGNYALTLDGLALKAGITARPLVVAGLAASDKVYDRTTTAAVAGTPRLEGAIGGDAIELDTSGLRASFADRNVGQAKPVSFAGLSLRGADAGNYALAALPVAKASITQRPLDPAGVRAADRLYDGTTAATLTDGGLRGVLDGDAVSLDISGAQASFADRGAGAGKPVTVTGLRLTGLDAGNYRLSEATPGVTATIDPRPLNPRFTAADRPYDGTTAARVEVADDRLASDRFTIDYSAAFADRHAGANKTVAISTITLRGPDAANYKPPTEARTTATVTVRPTATWTAPTSGDWMVAGNWDALPDRGNVAAVSIPSGVQVTYDGSTPVTLSSLTNAGVLVLRGPGLEAARLDNLGRLIIGSGASVDLSGRAVSGSGTLANEGTLGLAGSTVANRLENTGSLRLSGDNTLTSVASAGTAVLQGGTTTLSGAWVQTAGATALATGVGAAARLIAPGGVRIEGGRLSGSGGIVGDLSVISGALAPGASPGAIDVAGALRLGEGSVLDIELGGTTPGSFDTVSASGAVSIAGKLQISSVGGFAPKATDTFGFLNGASVSGLFADVTANGAELAALNLRNMKVGTAQGVVSLPAAALIAEDALIAQTLLTGASMMQPGSSVTSTSSTIASPTMVAGAPTGATMSSPQVEAPSAPPLKSGASTMTSSEDPASGTSAPGAPASGSGASGSTPADSGTTPPASPPAGAPASASTRGSADPAAPEPVRRTVLRTLDLPDAAPAETAAANREVTYTRSPSSPGSPSTSGARRSGC